MEREQKGERESKRELERLELNGMVTVGNGTGTKELQYSRGIEGNRN